MSRGGWVLCVEPPGRRALFVRPSREEEEVRMRLLSRRLSVVAITALMVVSGAFQATPALALPGGGGVTIGKGFDTCAAPSQSAVNAWWSNTPWTWIGVYIGGVERACSQPNLTASWLNTNYASGSRWRFEFLWVGLQAPCTSFRDRISDDSSTAYSQGVGQARSAVSALANLGVGSAAGTPVIYDMEAFDTSGDSRCLPAVQSFISGWDHQLENVAPAHAAGYYGSTCGSHVDAMWNASPRPSYINGANWDGNPSTGVLACVSSSHWTNHQRLKQYQGGHDETWNGVTLNIDSNCANGPLAPSATSFDNTACLPAAAATTAAASGTATATGAATAAARPCSLADLAVIVGGTGAYQGYATQELTFTNHAADACIIPGAPSMSVLLDDGSQQGIGPGQFASSRIDLQPGQSTLMLVGTPSACVGAGPSRSRVATRMALSLPAGGSVQVQGIDLDVQCGQSSVVLLTR